MDRSLGERLPGRGVRELEDRPFFNPLGDTGQVQQPVLAVHHPTPADTATVTRRAPALPEACSAWR